MWTEFCHRHHLILHENMITLAAFSSPVSPKDSLPLQPASHGVFHVWRADCQVGRRGDAGTAPWTPWGAEAQRLGLRHLTAARTTAFDSPHAVEARWAASFRGFWSGEAHRRDYSLIRLECAYGFPRRSLNDCGHGVVAVGRLLSRLACRSSDPGPGLEAQKWMAVFLIPLKKLRKQRAAPEDLWCRPQVSLSTVVSKGPVCKHFMEPWHVS